MRPALPSRLLAIALLISAGCDKPLVEWSDPEPIATATGEEASVLIVDSSGSARFVADSSASQITAPSPSARMCRNTLQEALGTMHAYAGWWQVRSDSSAGLYVERSSDRGHTWSAAIAIDTSDVSTNGCDRPAPSLTTVGDDVYVAYSMIAPEGKGVFFAHVMGGMLHAPVAVIYGQRLVHTAIAAQDPRVVVAYEDPNGSSQQIGVAMSTTQGHLFDWRTTASRSIDRAVRPAVALSGSMLAVSWAVPQSSDSTRRIVRVGRLH